MKAIMNVAMFATLVFSNIAIAGVYRCTDGKGNTSYQSTPCVSGNNIEMDINTGNTTDLTAKEKIATDKKEEETALVKQNEQKKLDTINLKNKRRKDAKVQSEMNQQLIRNNPIQFSAFAIPPYESDKLTENVNKYKTRLPEIEKFRRLAALKALATGNCNRVEEDDLSNLSKPSALVFSVACSSSKIFSFDEKELVEK